MLPDRKPREYLKVPRGIDPNKEEQFFLAANLIFGAPAVGKVDKVRQDFINHPEYTLRLSGVKGYLKLGKGVPFAELAYRHGYAHSQMGGLYRRYANWYFRNEVKREGVCLTSSQP